MAEEDELDLDIAELESFLDNFDITKTNDLLLVNEDPASLKIKSIDPKTVQEFIPKKSVPNLPNAVASTQIKTIPELIASQVTLSDSKNSTFSNPLLPPVQNSGEFVAPPLSSSFKNPLNKSSNQTDDVPSSEQVPYVYSNPLVKKTLENEVNVTSSTKLSPSSSSTLKTTIDQIQFKLPEVVDTVKTTVSTPPRPNVLNENTNAAVSVTSPPKKSNLRLPSKDDSVKSSETTTSEKSTVRVRSEKSFEPIIFCNFLIFSNKFFHSTCEFWSGCHNRRRFA